MSLTNKRIPGLSRPDPAQQRQIAQAWSQGTSAKKLRGRQLIFVGIAVVMGMLRAMGGNAGAGIASGIAALLLFSPILLYWNSQISKIHKRAAKLNAGQFLVTEAEGDRALSVHWTRHYVGNASARLADGTVLRSVAIPYYQAERMGNRSGTFQAWLVLIDGEDKPILFVR